MCAFSSLGAGAAAGCRCAWELACWRGCCVRLGALVLVWLQGATVVCVLGNWVVPLLFAHGCRCCCRLCALGVFGGVHLGAWCWFGALWRLVLLQGVAQGCCCQLRHVSCSVRSEFRVLAPLSKVHAAADGCRVLPHRNLFAVWDLCWRN